MGVQPDVWGPNLWGALHTVCLAGTVTPEFVQEFARVIPCQICATDFAVILSQTPFSETDPFEWSVRVHNQVNQKLGKPVVSVEKARARWSSRPIPEFHYKIIILIHLIVILILFMLRK